MDHMQIFRQAWQTVFRYRALWLFGFLVALTSVSSSMLLTGNSWETSEDEDIVFEVSEQDREWIKRNMGITLPDDFYWERGPREWNELTTEERRDLITLVASAFGVLALLIVITTVVRSVSRTALIRMVDEEAETGKQHSKREGFRLGWSRGALRVFLIDVAVVLPYVIFILFLLLVSVAPVLISAIGGEGPGLGSILASGTLFLLMIVGAIMVGILISMLVPTAYRAAVLDDLGVFSAIRESARLLRTRIRNLGLTWLVLAGLSMVWPMLMIPVFIVLSITGFIIAGLMALLTFGLVSLFASTAAPFVAAVAVGTLMFALLVGVPMTFLDGVKEVFASSSWTYTYRKAKMVAEFKEKPLPAAAALQS